MTAYDKIWIPLCFLPILAIVATIIEYNSYGNIEVDGIFPADMNLVKRLKHSRVYKKYAIAECFVCMLLGPIVAAANLAADKWGGLPKWIPSITGVFWIFVVIEIPYHVFLKCPICGWRLPHKLVGGSKARHWRPIFVTKCPHCGKSILNS